MNRRYVAASLIIAGLILIGFWLSVPHTRDIQVKKAQVPAPFVSTVTVHDVFKKGVHTLTGTVLAPNACTGATVQGSLSNDGVSQKIILAVDMPIDTDRCLQVSTPISFKVTVTAPSGVPIVSTVNGATASTTLQ